MSSGLAAAAWHPAALVSAGPFGCLSPRDRRAPCVFIGLSSHHLMWDGWGETERGGDELAAHSSRLGPAWARRDRVIAQAGGCGHSWEGTTSAEPRCGAETTFLTKSLQAVCFFQASKAADFAFTVPVKSQSGTGHFLKGCHLVTSAQWLFIGLVG